MGDFIYYRSIGLDYIEGLPFDGSLLANNYLILHCVEELFGSELVVIKLIISHIVL